MEKTLAELQIFKKRCNDRKNGIAREIACLKKEYNTLDDVIGNIEDVIEIAELEIEEESEEK